MCIKEGITSVNARCERDLHFEKINQITMKHFLFLVFVSFVFSLVAVYTCIAFICHLTARPIVQHLISSQRRLVLPTMMVPIPVRLVHPVCTGQLPHRVTSTDVQTCLEHRKCISQIIKLEKY